jgi:hypothetical protein
MIQITQDSRSLGGDPVIQGPFARRVVKTGEWPIRGVPSFFFSPIPHSIPSDSATAPRHPFAATLTLARDSFFNTSSNISPLFGSRTVVSVPVQQSPPQRNHISSEADAFAREMGLWGWIVQLRTFVRQELKVAILEIELVHDPELETLVLICLTIKSTAPLGQLLQWDDKLRNFVCEEIPPAQRQYFAFRFDQEG